jgi:hypothetical protein
MSSSGLTNLGLCLIVLNLLNCPARALRSPASIPWIGSNSAATPTKPRLPQGAKMMAASTGEAAAALSFCRSSPDAVIVTVWPTARSHARAARDWVESSGGKVLCEREAYVQPSGAVPTLMALYFGEEWIHSNCW